MPVRRWLCRAVAMIALGALALSASPADRIVLMVGGLGKQIYLPARLAQRLGYFDDEGIEVELRSEPAGISAADALLAGAAQGVVGFYDHVIRLQARGKSTIAVVQLGRAPGEALLIAERNAAQIREPADLRGKALGVTGFGASTQILTQYIAASAGLRPHEYTLFAAGSGTPFVDALRGGRIDAGMTTEPTISRLLRTQAARVLVDLRTPEATDKVVGGIYPGACVYMQAAWVRGHRAQTRKIVGAFVRALDYIATHTASEIAAQLPPDDLGGDPAEYVQSLDAAKSMYTRDGRMPESGPQTVLRVLASVDRTIRANKIDLARTYTSEFVDAAAH